MTSLHALKIKIFADGADKAGMLDLYADRKSVVRERVLWYV